MQDPRIHELAKLFVEYSVKVKPKERVLIIAYGLQGYPLMKECYKLCLEAGAFPRYEIRTDEMSRMFYDHANEEYQLTDCPEYAFAEAEATDAMIQIIADTNKMEMAKIDQEKAVKKRKATKKLSDIFHKKKWVLFEYPTAAGAQDAGRSLEEWEDFVFDACIQDWEAVSKEQEVLKNLMEATKQVHIVADGTDLLVNIEGQKAVKCCGECNMPDGEVFTSPHRTDVNGHITFNTPTVYMGKEFNEIKIEFKDGKAIKAESDINSEDLNKILDTDEGARYLGEFAFGTNKMIQDPVKSILFDEKIGGSTHMAFGKCYDEAPNGNDSAIHWDMIIRHKDANGKVYFDDILIQENGIWVHEDLKSFN